MFNLHFLFSDLQTNDCIVSEGQQDAKLETQVSKRLQLIALTTLSICHGFMQGGRESFLGQAQQQTAL